MEVLYPILTLLVMVGVLRFVGSVTSGIEWDDYAATFIVAALLTAAGWGLDRVWTVEAAKAALPNYILTQLALNFVILLVTGLLLPGMKLRGVFGFLAAVVGVTAVAFGMPYVIAQIISGRFSLG
jgi:hypothetical protein